MLMTVGVTILFAVIIARQYPVIRDEGRAAPIFTTTACLLIYGLSYAFRPTGYSVTAEELVVHRPIGKVRIKRSDIQSAEAVDPAEVSGSIRTFGVGGLFGYYGRFANFNLGRMTWYATRRDRTVLVRAAQGRKIVLTPDDREGLVAALRA